MPKKEPVTLDLPSDTVSRMREEKTRTGAPLSFQVDKALRERWGRLLKRDRKGLAELGLEKEAEAIVGENG